MPSQVHQCKNKRKRLGRNLNSPISPFTLLNYSHIRDPRLGILYTHVFIIFIYVFTIVEIF